MSADPDFRTAENRRAALRQRARSVFIRNNLSADAARSADAFHIAQCRENREWMEGNNQL